jgi:hypothetical protein
MEKNLIQLIDDGDNIQVFQILSLNQINNEIFYNCLYHSLISLNYVIASYFVSLRKINFNEIDRRCQSGNIFIELLNMDPARM